MNGPDQTQPTQPEAAKIPTRTPFEQQRLAKELATIERDKGIDALRAIEAVLLECAQAPKDRSKVIDRIHELERSRKEWGEKITHYQNLQKFYLKDIANPSDQDIISKILMMGDDPFSSEADPPRSHTAYFEPRLSVNVIPSASYMSGVLRRLGINEEAQMFNQPSLFLKKKPNYLPCTSLESGISVHASRQYSELVFAFTPEVFVKVINYTPSPAPATPQGSA